MNKPKISPDFTIEDIHRIREANEERRQAMTKEAYRAEVRAARQAKAGEAQLVLNAFVISGTMLRINPLDTAVVSDGDTARRAQYAADIDRMANTPRKPNYVKCAGGRLKMCEYRLVCSFSQ